MKILTLSLIALSSLSISAFAGHFGTDEDGNQVWYGGNGNWSIIYGGDEQGLGWRNREGGYDYYMVPDREEPDYYSDDWN